MLRMIDTQLLAIKELQQHADAFEAELAAVERSNEAALRLRQAPGIGVLGSTALAAVDRVCGSVDEVMVKRSDRGLVKLFRC